MKKQKPDQMPVTLVAPVHPVFSAVEEPVAITLDFFGCKKFDLQNPRSQDNLSGR